MALRVNMESLTTSFISRLCYLGLRILAPDDLWELGRQERRLVEDVYGHGASGAVHRLGVWL